MVPIDRTSFNDLATRISAKSASSPYPANGLNLFSATFFNNVPKKSLGRPVNFCIQYCSLGSTEEGRSQCENASRLRKFPDSLYWGCEVNRVTDVVRDGVCVGSESDCVSEGALYRYSVYTCHPLRWVEFRMFILF